MLSHVKEPRDLVTSAEAIRDGFQRQALAKVERAEPYLIQAREFSVVLNEVDDIERLGVDAPESIRDALWSAAGLSLKALNRIQTDADRRRVLTEVIARIRASAPDDWRRELLFRFLLTKGDALGGSMRNYIGALGAARLTQAILDRLTRLEIQPDTQPSKGNRNKLSSISWENRILFFDKKIGQNNVDAVLVDASRNRNSANLAKDRSTHLAYGELKGGIDPAGADEHWKTARTAIDRLRRLAGEAGHTPKLFITAAAIEAAMAQEIFENVENGQLHFAANLTVPEQVADLAEWLVGL